MEKYKEIMGLMHGYLTQLEKRKDKRILIYNGNIKYSMRINDTP